jgi:hypothetical protein
MDASNEPRSPDPIRPTEIFELACDPRTTAGGTMKKSSRLEGMAI